MAKIMLVEDDNNLREIYGARLMAEGYDIVAAKDGEEALAIAVKEKPDLIISDVMMPKISGFDMLDILRTTPETKNTKVIMMTALSQAEDKARADKLGADRYLVKSQVTLEDVAHVVKEVLESGAPTAAAEPAATPPALPVAEAVAVDAVTSSSSEPAVPEPVATQPEPINLPAPQPFTATEPAAAEPVMAQPPADQPAPQPFTEAAAAPAEAQPAPQPYVAPAETPAFTPQPVMDEPASAPPLPTADTPVVVAQPAPQPYVDTSYSAPVSAVTDTPSAPPLNTQLQHDIMSAQTSTPAPTSYPTTIPVVMAPSEPAAAEPVMAQPPADQPAPQPFTEAAAAPAEAQPAPQPYVAPAETPAPAPSGPPAANTGIDPNSIAL